MYVAGHLTHMSLFYNHWLSKRKGSENEKAYIVTAQACYGTKIQRYPRRKGNSQAPHAPLCCHMLPTVVILSWGSCYFGLICWPELTLHIGVGKDEQSVHQWSGCWCWTYGFCHPVHCQQPDGQCHTHEHCWQPNQCPTTRSLQGQLTNKPCCPSQDVVACATLQSNRCWKMQSIRSWCISCWKMQSITSWCMFD